MENDSGKAGRNNWSFKAAKIGVVLERRPSSLYVLLMLLLLWLLPLLLLSFLFASVPVVPSMHMTVLDGNGRHQFDGIDDLD